MPARQARYIKIERSVFIKVSKKTEIRICVKCYLLTKEKRNTLCISLTISFVKKNDRQKTSISAVVFLKYSPAMVCLDF